jgi:hypothetical protein
MSAASAPVSAARRETNVMPWEFTTSLATIVAISSRRSGCSVTSEPNRSTTREGKYDFRSSSK